MRLLQICVSYTFLSVFFFQLQKYEANACSLGCTCTTIPARDGDAVDEDDEGGDVTGDNVGDEGELTLPQAPRGRKVSCSNNPYPFTSIEEVRTAITIPLDTIYLDLSENKISLIEPGAFQGLTQLTRLVLSNNKLNTVPDGTFNDLPALRRIDVQSEYLRCDCHLAWIVKWSKDRKVKIRSSTTCAVPRELNGVALKKLKKKDLHCDRPLELSLFEIMPGIDQIVFEGDKIPFDCQASIVDPKTEMFWLRDGAGNVTKTVTLVVIDSDAPQCEMNTTKTNKGVYVWKESVAGITKELPCKLGEGKVTHMCDKNGRWTSLNLSQCDFTNELTRKLQTLAKDTNSSKILSDARNLERLVSAPFRNAEDPLSTINPEYVDLASLAIHRLSQHAAIGDEDPLTSILVQKSVIHPPVVSPSEEDGNVTVTTTQAPTNSGSGDWRTDGCDIIEKTPALVTVHCDHLTAFAILEDESLVAASMFQMMAIAVYIGSCVCLLCLMAVFITYVSCFRFLSVPRKMKHSVINICLSLLLLIIGFTMGVQRTDHLRACQVVGIVLHYLSLVVLFWFTVTASNMLKKFRKTEKPPPPPIDLPMPLPPKPIIRFYLLAWGVPTIICGITAAISFDFYTEPDCFLDWQPSLGAFFGPVVFLLLLNVIFYLRIACIIRSSTGPLVNMEETQELQSNDIEMTHNHDRIETASLRSDMSTKSSVSSVMDSERRPVTQLRALALCLILFVFTWLFGAITVAKPFTFMPYQDIIFSYLYGVFCAILGLFMLIFFCLTRKDSLSSWKRFFLCEQHHVYNANPVMEACEPQANGHVNTGSGSEISKINSVVVTNHVNHVKKSDDEMSSIVLVPSKPTSDVNSSANNSLNEAAASFYNPKQNGVAKKFWDKKNKHNSKLLTKEMTKSLNIHASESEFSGSEQPRGQSLGYSSDGNTINKPKKLNLDLQIHRPAGCESDNTSAISPVQPQSPPSYTAAMTTSTPSAPPFSHMVNLHGQENRVGSPSAMQNGSIPANVYHARSNSSSSLGKRVQGSAFAVVPPRNNTLPKQGKLSLPSSPEREMPDNTVSVPSSVARLGDFDGSSQVSSSYSHERVRSPHPGDPQYMAGYTSPPDGAFYKQYGPIDERAVGSPTQSHNSHRNRTNSGGYGSDNSNRQRKQMENNFLQQVEQRIPQGSAMNSPYSPKPVNANHLHVNSAGNGVTNHNHVTHKPPISPVSDSDNNGSHKTFPDSDSQVHYNNKKPPARYNDSDHNSEPASQSQKMVRSRDTHKHSKHGLKKQRSLDWDEQFKEPKSPSQSVPYAYVNHNYTERVLQKLNNMAVTEHIDPKSKAFWVPRSSRSYNQLVQQEHARMCEDSTTSSSDDDDSLDNIWVLKKEKRAKKNKKETSV
ncbi:AGRA1-like protein [Mya arenaria]|uniref:AGRA1-like protein n=1 Tax=Mya arenaria TaxID=6604 RepID=A0ABY7FIB7_MYAAR|nr:AGRA1-like protein [Mya arenaria]